MAIYHVAHMNETSPGGGPVTLETLWTIALSTTDKATATAAADRRNRRAMASGGWDRRIWRVREVTA